MDFVQTHSGLLIVKNNITALEVVEIDGETWVMANLNSPVISDPNNYGGGGQRTHICRIAQVDNRTSDTLEAIATVLAANTHTL